MSLLQDHPLTEPGPLLKAVSRSFYLSLRFLPATTRGPLSLGYLLARTSDTLADSESLPVEARIEALNAFDHAIQNELPFSLPDHFPHFKVPHPGEQELLRRSAELQNSFLAQPESVRTELRRVMATIIRGQRDDLRRFGNATGLHPTPIQTPTDLEDYTYAVAGCVGEFWTRICTLALPDFSDTPLDTLLKHGRLFGQGLQLVNILRDLPADLRSGRCYLPESELKSLGLTPGTLLSSGIKARPVFLSWLEKAALWLESGALYEQSIHGILLKSSVALPRILGMETLNALRETPPLETVTRVKINRATVLTCAARSVSTALVSSAPCY